MKDSAKTFEDLFPWQRPTDWFCRLPSDWDFFGESQQVANGLFTKAILNSDS